MWENGHSGSGNVQATYRFSIQEIPIEAHLDWEFFEEHKNFFALVIFLVEKFLINYGKSRCIKWMLYAKENQGDAETVDQIKVLSENNSYCYEDMDSKINEFFTKVVDELPEGRQPELLNLIQKFASKARSQPPRPLPTNQAQMKDWGIETYPQYKTRMKTVEKSLATDGKECLKQNWGMYLKAFSKEINGYELERDYICKADLQHLDVQLLDRLRKLYNAEELDSFLPSLPALNKQIAKALTDEEKREAYRTMSLLNRSLDKSLEVA